MLVLKGFVGLNRTIQLQLLQRYWLGHINRHVDMRWGGRKGKVNRETEIDMCKIDGGRLLSQRRELSRVLCDNLERWEEGSRGRGYMFT